jgi:hypothetical protein
MPSTRCSYILPRRLHSIIKTTVRQALSAHSLTRHSRSFTTPHALRQKVDLAVASAWAPSTRRLYNSAVLRFLQFCDGLGVPVASRLPAEEDILCAYAASLMGSRSGSSIKNDISGLRAWHLYHNMPFKGGNRLGLVLRGAEAHSPPSSKRPPRAPASVKMLTCLHNALDHSDPFDAACLAAASVAFWSQSRLGELLPVSLASLASANLPTRSDLHGRSPSGASRILHLPSTKCSKIRGEDIIICQQLPPTDPLGLLEAHLAINVPGPSDLLFSYLHGSSRLPLVRTKFLARCNSVWLRNGLPSITGHSFRIGGTSELLVRGVPPDIVKMLGRWSSDSFLRYWRHLDSIAPLYVSCLQPPSRIDSRVSSSSAPGTGDAGLPRGRASSSALAPPRCGRIRLRPTAHPRHGSRLGRDDLVTY